VATDRDDDPGVLGNLPRSRPGRRSDKRGSAGARKKPAAKRATTTRSSASSQRSKRSTTAASRTPPPRPRASQPSSPDPITQAVQLAGKVAAVGVKTAAGIIKRLPGR
jgi:hypothetical protein